MEIKRLRGLSLILLGLAVLGAACGDDGMAMPDGGMAGTDSGMDNPDGNGGGDGGMQVPTGYEFESAFDDGMSSVSYSGQIFRQVLVGDLKSVIEGITEQIDGATFPGAEGGLPSEDGQVVAVLDSYYRFDGETSGSLPIGVSTEPAAMQMTYEDIASGKDLVSKTAGNDDVTDHKNWNDGDFVGWSDDAIAANGGSIDSPEGLIVAFFETIEANALGRAGGTFRHGVDGQGEAMSESLPVHVTESGLDLGQLVQKFLLGAVNYSQATDDYLDSGATGVEGKGLLSDNVERDGDAPYTTLEHHFDEGFGYFGAARDYLDYTDEEIAGAGGRDGRSSGYHDTNGDGSIDLLSEYNFALAGYAAKRDLGSSDEAPTDFTREAFEGFVAARAIINAAVGRELMPDEMTQLEAHRDAAVLAWEKTVAANVVHYLNDTLEAMGHFGTTDYDFVDHAEVWSEMKGFALGLQFNPRSQLSSEQFVELHGLLGDAPMLPGAEEADVTSYRMALLDARDLLQEAYGFDDANMGDDNGMGGW